MKQQIYEIKKNKSLVKHLYISQFVSQDMRFSWYTCSTRSTYSPAGRMDTNSFTFLTVQDFHASLSIKARGLFLFQKDLQIRWNKPADIIQITFQTLKSSSGVSETHLETSSPRPSRS